MRAKNRAIAMRVEKRFHLICGNQDGETLTSSQCWQALAPALSTRSHWLVQLDSQPASETSPFDERMGFNLARRGDWTRRVTQYAGEVGENRLANWRGRRGLGETRQHRASVVASCSG